MRRPIAELMVQEYILNRSNRRTGYQLESGEEGFIYSLGLLRIALGRIALRRVAALLRRVALLVVLVAGHFGGFFGVLVSGSDRAATRRRKEKRKFCFKKK